MGEYYYINNNILSTSISPVEIEAPISWEKTQIKFMRSQTYLGLIRGLTTPYAFVLNGATILRILNDQQGIEAICFLKIDIINQANGTWEYVEFANFGLDFSTYNDGQYTDNDIVTNAVQINAVEDGVYKYIRENENVDFEIPILDIDCVKVNVGGVKLQGIYKYAPVSDNRITNTSASYILISNVFYSNEGAYQIENTNNQTNALLNTALVSMPSTNTENFSMEALIDQGITFYIKQEIKIENDPTSNRNIDFFVVRLLVCDPPPTPGTNAAITQDVIVYTQLFNGVGSNPAAIAPGGSIQYIFEQAYNTVISITNKQRVYVIFQPGYNIAPPTPFVLCRVTWFGNGATTQAYQHNFLPAFIRPDSLDKGYRAYTFWDKLVQAFTENNYHGVSNYLSNSAINNIDLKPYNLIVTCADALRQLTGAVIKTKLADAFKNFAMQFCMGLFVDGNNNIRLEPLSDIFDKNTLIADLGIVRCTIKPAIDFFFNDVKIGYPNISYDEINGRNEYNAGHEYKLPLARIPVQQDMISVYRMDCYGVEYTRANIINKTTIDTSTDNDVFLLDIGDTPTSGVFPLNRPAGATITGLPYPDTNYNISGTPKRDELRNNPLSASILYAINPNNKIRFQKADKNSALVSNLGSGTITENADILISSLGAPLFQPFLFTVRSTVPLNIQALLAATPNGFFSFTMEQTMEQFKGFLWEVAITPSANPVYDYVLLGHPDNDMSKTVY